MHPILLEYKGFTVYNYGFAMVCAFCLCAGLAMIKLPEFMTVNDFINFCLITLVVVLWGDKVFLLLTGNIPYSWQSFTSIKYQPSHSFYGTLTLTLLFICLYCRIKHIPVLATLDFLFLYALPGLAIQRSLGCFMAGCCFGSPTDLPWGIGFPGNSPAGKTYPDVPLHPTQLYYSISSLVLFFALNKSKKKFCRNGDLFLTGMIILCGLYMYISLYRGDRLPEENMIITTYNCFSIFMCVGGLMLLFRNNLYFLFKSVYKKMCTLFLLCTLFLIPVAQADELTININKPSVIKWGEVITMQIEAKNPMYKTVQGGITVSFSSRVMIIKKDSQSTVYLENSKARYKISENKDKCCIYTKDLMVENWYKWWPSKKKFTMTIEFIPIQTGVLKINARVAFLYRDSNRKKCVKYIPEYSSYTDQQRYPVNVRRVSVEGSQDFLKNFELLTNFNDIFSSKEFSENIQALIDDPHNKAALRYFGITSNYAQASQYIYKLKQTIENKPHIRHSPKFLVNLKRLINNPTDAKALEFFGITIKDNKQSFSERRRSRAAKDAEAYITSLPGGFSLISLIHSEGDITFVHSYSKRSIVFKYKGKEYFFPKNNSIVYNIARKIPDIKPHSKYISEIDPFSKSSYHMLINMNFQKKKSNKNENLFHKIHKMSNQLHNTNYKPKYITQLSFTNPMTSESLLMSDKSMSMNKAIIAGINNFIKNNKGVQFNARNHKLDDNFVNANKLMNITYNSNLTSKEKTEKIARELLSRNSIDAILYGMYIDKGTAIEIRQKMTVNNSKTYQRYYTFSKQEFFCRDSKSFELILCPKAFSTVSSKVEELLSLLE